MSTEGPVALPSQFGRYTLIERLAVGGMAEVFRAKIVSSHGFEKVIVIKRILPHLAADRTFVSMFIDEAKLTAQLTHPKIVQILDFGDVAGQYFIALEFIDGFDALGMLRTCAQRRLAIPIHIAVFVIMEVLEALDYAHNARDMEGRAMQIVHRDISPSNIFISKRGDVKLGDFGIAHAQERESKTQAGTLKGKYGYMSPEQVTGGVLDGRSDLFAVGIVLAEMLMGKRLYTAPADLDVLLMVRDARTDRLDKFGSDWPPALNRIVRHALKKDAAERHQSGTEFRDALAEYLYEMGKRVSATDLRKFVSELFQTPAPATGELPAAKAAAPAAPKPARAPTPAPPPVPTSARRPPPGVLGPRPTPPSDAPRPTPLTTPAVILAAEATAAGRRSPAPAPPTSPAASAPGRGGDRIPRARAATWGGSSPARPRGHPTARVISASSRRCGSSPIWRSPARPVSCASRSRARPRRSTWSMARPSRSIPACRASASASTWSRAVTLNARISSAHWPCCHTTRASWATRWWRWA
jgi:serine/threonine protein kinase